MRAHGGGNLNSKNLSFIAGKNQNRNQTGKLENRTWNRAHKLAWGTTWHRTGTHTDTNYRWGTGQRANTWETQVTRITKARWGGSKTEYIDLQSKTGNRLAQNWTHTNTRNHKPQRNHKITIIIHKTLGQRPRTVTLVNDWRIDSFIITSHWKVLLCFFLFFHFILNNF